MLDVNQMGISLFIIAGAVMFIIGAARVYRNRQKRNKKDEDN